MLIQPAAVTGLSTMIKRLVSSANNRILEPMPCTISLIYNKNKIGPRIAPWGTPARIEAQSERMIGALRVNVSVVRVKGGTEDIAQRFRFLFINENIYMYVLTLIRTASARRF